MLNIGQYNELVVQRKVAFGFYLNPKPDEVLLPLKYAPKGLKVGDTLRVFVYTDSEDRPVATTLKPKAVVGECACLAARDRAPFGMFMDWGLEKDLLVPKKEQPPGMKVGKKYVVKVCLDARTNRVYGTTHIAAACQPAPPSLAAGAKVDILVYRIFKVGYFAVVTHTYAGLLYKDQVFEPLEVGDRREGYVTRLRDDGKLDLSLKKPGYGSVNRSGSRIMQALEKGGGFIACHDKSSPEKIRSTFGLSKKEFKRAIGGLYKAGRIDIQNDGIRLKQTAAEPKALASSPRPSRLGKRTRGQEKFKKSRRKPPSPGSGR
jgi:predicted RNA-binding protein (virulence factor B family)